MTNAAKKIIEEALELSANEREEMIDALVASLPRPPGLHEAEDGYLEEIDRRVQAAIDGQGNAWPWAEVYAELRAKR